MMVEEVKRADGQDAAPKAKVFFYVTGFGKFCGVSENPTSIMVRDLPTILPLQNCDGKLFQLAHVEVLTVAIEDCDEALERIYQIVLTHYDSAEHHVILNLGVAANRQGFALEKTGKNIKNFRVADERGNQPKNVPIDGQRETIHTI